MPFFALDKVTPTRVQWLWPGRLALGHLALLDGDPGIGKSLVTLDLCARMTTGRPFPDGTGGGTPASVIVINAEDGARDTIPGRLRAAGADLARVHVYERSAGEAFLRLPGQVRRLEDAIAQSGARYVVLDPIMSFLDSNVNVASDQRVRAALAPLTELASRHQCVIQLVRHLNKGSGKNALYRGLYSIGFIASSRVSWLIARDPLRSKQYVLAQPKNNLDPPQASLAYRIESADSGIARIAWQGPSPQTDVDLMQGTPERLRIRMRAQEFLTEFLKDGPRSTREIWPAAQERRISRRTLDRARATLDITVTRIKTGTPDQTNFWILPNQKITDAISDSPGLDETFRNLGKQLAPRTPLDEEIVRLR